MRQTKITPVLVPFRIFKGEAFFLHLNNATGDPVGFKTGYCGPVMPCCKPAVLAKGNRSKKDFPAKMMIGKPLADLPESQMKHPPVAAVILNKVTVTDSLDFITA
ncbi:hypothetical protein D3C75_847820 [compost metagenome]